MKITTRLLGVSTLLLSGSTFVHASDTLDVTFTQQGKVHWEKDVHGTWQKVIQTTSLAQLVTVPNAYEALEDRQLATHSKWNLSQYIFEQQLKAAMNDEKEQKRKEMRAARKEELQKKQERDAVQRDLQRSLWRKLATLQNDQQEYKTEKHDLDEATTANTGIKLGNLANQLADKKENIEKDTTEIMQLAAAANLVLNTDLLEIEVPKASSSWSIW